MDVTWLTQNVYVTGLYATVDLNYLLIKDWLNTVLLTTNLEI